MILSVWSISALLATTIAFCIFKFKNAKTGDLHLLPGPKSHFLIGNVLEVVKDPLAAFQAFTEHAFEHRTKPNATTDEKVEDEDLPVGMFRYSWYLGESVVVVIAPHVVKQVLSNKVKHFAKEQDEVIKAVVGDGLLLANGKLWETQKRLMTPAFGYGYMKLMIPCFVQSTKILIDKWTRLTNKPLPVTNVHADMTSLTLDVIGLAGFGYSFNAQLENTESHDRSIPDAITQILHETERRVFSFLPLWKLPFMPSSMKFRSSMNILYTEINKMIQERKAQGTTEHAEDLLGRLLAAKDPNTGEEISERQLTDELVTFLIAGHETTAAMLGFVFYTLSQYPEVEEKLLSEIDKVLGNETPDFDKLNSLTYMDLVIKETMRLYPSVSMQTARTAVDDVELGGYRIPRGTTIEIWPYLIHRSPHFWREPEKFEPERHLENPKAFTYLPFGAGPRECIGKKLALFEAKVVLSMVLQRFTLRMEKGHNMKPILTVTLRPDDLIMRLQTRNKNTQEVM